MKEFVIVIRIDYRNTSLSQVSWEGSNHSTGQVLLMTRVVYGLESTNQFYMNKMYIIKRFADVSYMFSKYGFSVAPLSSTLATEQICVQEMFRSDTISFSHHMSSSCHAIYDSSDTLYIEHIQVSKLTVQSFSCSAATYHQKIICK